MQRRVRSFDDTVIVYDSMPGTTATWLFFVHGAGGDLRAWDQERAWFRKHQVSTLAIDLRGHGLSARPDKFEAYELVAFAQDIQAVLDKEQITKYILVGHCFGGMVTMTHHQLYPNTALGYVLVDTTYKAPRALTHIFRHHAFFVGFVNRLLASEHLRRSSFVHVDFAQFVGSRDWDYHRIFSDITHTSFKSWLYTYEHLALFNATKALQSIRRPTLILEGTADSIFPPNISQKIHALVPHSALELFPGQNHLIVLNAAEALVKSIFSFMNKVTKQAPKRSLNSRATKPRLARVKKLS